DDLVTGVQTCALPICLRLVNTVLALHALALDPRLKTRVPLADGRELTALEIQASYLEECEQALQRGNLPDWAPEAVDHWRATLRSEERRVGKEGGAGA